MSPTWLLALLIATPIAALILGAIAVHIASRRIQRQRRGELEFDTPAGRTALRDAIDVAAALGVPRHAAEAAAERGRAGARRVLAAPARAHAPAQIPLRVDERSPRGRVVVVGSDGVEAVIELATEIPATYEGCALDVLHRGEAPQPPHGSDAA